MAKVAAKIIDLTALLVGRAIRRLAVGSLRPFTGSAPRHPNRPGLGGVSRSLSEDRSRSEGYGFFLPGATFTWVFDAADAD